MGRGFLAGIFWGGVVGIGMLGVSSQVMDRQQLSFPKPEASAVDVPGGSQFDQAREETDPVLPGTEGTPGAGEIVTAVIPPEDAVETPPAFDTSSLDVPQPTVEGPSGLGDVPEVAEDVTVPESGDTGRVGSSDTVAGAPASPSLAAPSAPVIAPETDTEAPAPGVAPEAEEIEAVEAGSEESAPGAGTEVAALPSEAAEAAPSVGDSAPVVQSDSDSPVAPVSPEISEAPSMPGVVVPDAGEAPSGGLAAAQPEAVEPEAPVGAVDATPDAPVAEAAPEPEPQPGPTPQVVEVPDSGGVVTADGGDTQFFTPVETFQDRAEGVEVNRLPTIGGDDDDALPVVRRLPGTPLTEGEPEAEADAVDEVAAPGAAAEGPAIRAYAMDFDLPEGAAIVSVILIHEGSEPISASELKRLPASVDFAIDAGTPNAAGIASAYRSAGRELVMIPSLPSGAAPQDVEVALSANLEAIPQAVALMDVSGSSFQSDRAAVAQVVDVIADTGHGLITFPRGLNTAHQQAERAGLPTGLIFRLLDGENETDEQIRRTLDRAAFRARQSDGVILVGKATPATMAAVAAWAADAGSDVVLAPVSKALRAE